MVSAWLGKIDNHFVNVTDPRTNRGHNYPFNELLLLALCAAICDCNHWTDVVAFGKAKLDWLRKFLPFENGIPSHDCLSDVFCRLDTVEFYAALESWTREMIQSLHDQTVAFDGKTLRGSHDAASGKSALHSISAWACGLRLCIGLKSTAEKSNEIPAVQQLIDTLDLKGATITADAMHCQRETANKIIAKEADYILIAKGNQSQLQAAIDQAITAALERQDRNVREDHQSEQNRGRTEERTVIVLPVPKEKVFLRWAGIKSIGMIYRHTVNGEHESEQQEYFISSRPAKVRDLAKRIRQHWSIENSQHNILDVTFGEDASRIRNGNGPEIISVFRRLALNILQQDTSLKLSLRAKRKVCAWDESAFEKLLAAFCEV